jgi:hypothetical protein
MNRPAANKSAVSSVNYQYWVLEKEPSAFVSQGKVTGRKKRKKRP